MYLAIIIIYYNRLQINLHVHVPVNVYRSVLHMNNVQYRGLKGSKVLYMYMYLANYHITEQTTFNSRQEVFWAKIHWAVLPLAKNGAVN